MATILQDGQELKRLVKVYGVEGLVEVTLTVDGLSFRVPKTRKHVTLTWAKAAAAASPGPDVPCWLANDPVKLLSVEAGKVAQRAAKKI